MIRNTIRAEYPNSRWVFRENKCWIAFSPVTKNRVAAFMQCTFNKTKYLSFMKIHKTKNKLSSRKYFFSKYNF